MADRFGHFNENEIQVLLEKSAPKYTEMATKFGMKVFDGK